MKLRKLICLIAIFATSYTTGAIVTTFVNSTQLDIKLEIRFSDDSTTTKFVSMAQSCEVVNFDNKRIISIVFSSENRDQNGNFYTSLQQYFPKFTKNLVYRIGLEDVPAHTKPATTHTEAFEMPATQMITCTLKI